MTRIIIGSVLAVLLGKKMGFESTRFLGRLAVSGFLREIGLGLLPEALAQTTDPLTLPKEKQEQYFQHPNLGSQMLNRVKGIPTEVVQAVAQFHERCNGTGYPQKLKRPQIITIAKILTLADAAYTEVYSQAPRWDNLSSFILSVKDGQSDDYDREILAKLKT